ncbi:MAG: DNA-protecting protein DprA [Armatimonadetes bacterium]|nr:MAG: DNA-protecting protein DprA [Armatimonadota bacterium]MCE7900496.1 DNA-protecting protein DprA [Armatimonadetes bacterium ATM1]MDL1928384.1 DNA-protecting protein DprA [Fimbriimonadia bacterium ATM]MBC6969061.1 DNA-protecting protein DprA [Armatimonadota bacterium]MBL1150025.1 DNA-protecting protein DprA [Armatimonadota bacterium]
MRDIEFWQALLSLDLPPSRARALLDRLGPSCLSVEDLRASDPFAEASKRVKPRRGSPARHPVGDVRVLELGSAEYPKALSESEDPPPALFVRGSLVDCDEPAVAIVGTRGASSYGKAVARQIASELAKGGVTVVSGGAQGVDANAHLGALEAGGRTIAVLGSGLDRPYPVSNRGLFDRIAQSGAVVSQFPLGAKPDRWRFPLRNYTIAGLVRAVVVVEAPEQSGSLITARAAADEGKLVFVTPGPITSTTHRGGFRLINDGATLLYTPDQVFEGLGIARRVAQPVAPSVTPMQRKILDSLGVEPILVDSLGDALDIPPGELLAELTTLEILGLVLKSGAGYSKL